MVVQWCDTNSSDEKVVHFLTVHQPNSANAKGLFASLEYGLKCLSTPSLSRKTCTKLVGIATDGASPKIASGSLKGLEVINLVFWIWCLAHLLELSIKDALKLSFIDSIDELLLRFYETSKKKRRELESVVADSKECFE